MMSLIQKPPSLAQNDNPTPTHDSHAHAIPPTSLHAGPGCRRRLSVPLGALCGAGEVEKRLAQGFNFLAVGGDTGPSAGVLDAVSIGRKFKAKP